MGSDAVHVGRIVSSTGVAPSYQIDPVYGMPYAQFNGSGGLRLNSGWTGINPDFTVSFWIQHNGTGSFFTGVTSLTWPMQVKYYPPCWNCWINQIQETYTTDLAQNIFTSGEDGSVKMIMDYNGKCSIRWAKSTIQISNVFMGSYYAFWFKSFEAWNNLQENFNCSALMDKKWHSIVLLSKWWSTSIYIDGNEAIKYSWYIPVWKNISIASSDFNSTFYSWNFLPAQINAISNSKFLKANLSAFRLYSRALSVDELESVVNEFKYAQSELLGAGNIQVTMDKYTKPILYANFRNIPLSLNKDEVIYEYSTSTGIFSPITNITQIGVWSGTIDYKIGVDLLGKPDGKINVVFRVRASDQSFQNIGTVGFMKLDTQAEIIINQPNSELSIDKTITANAQDAQLYMFQTRGSICDATITAWIEYSDLIFTQKWDNGIRICYKAVFPWINKTIYKLSAAIQWIQTKDLMIGSSGIFSDYTLWTKSLFQKPNDTTYMMLDLLGVSPGSSQGTINGTTMTDINGDGLVDFLYSVNGTADYYGNRNNYRSIIINNWNYTFKSVYKCAIGVTSANVSTFYWDCADITR